MALDKTELRKVVDSLCKEAQPYLDECKSITLNIVPNRGEYDNQKPNAQYANYRRMLTNVADRALSILVQGLMSGLTSKSKPWFRLSVSDFDMEREHSVKTWLYNTQQKLYRVFAKSNLYGALKLIYKEIAAFGTACALVESDFENVINITTLTVGQYYLGVNDNGKVDTCARKFQLNVKQIVDKFGYENVSDDIQRAYKDNRLDEYKTIYHLVQPNFERVYGLKDNKNMPFISVYFTDDNTTHDFLRVSGYEDFPVLTPRWEIRTTQDSYGTGPGWTVVKTVQEIYSKISSKLKAIQKKVDPPMQATENVKDSINLLPGGVTRVPQGKDSGLRTAYNIELDINHLRQDILESKEEIYSAFYADIFLMSSIDDKTMTAKEAGIRYDEKLGMLGMVVEQLEVELLQPLFDKVLNIMQRAGLIEPAPDVLQGREIDYDYIGILAQAQKQIGLSNLNSGIMALGSLMDIQPDVIDNFDADAALVEIFDVSGINPNLLRDPKLVEMMRQKRAEAAAIAAQQEQIAKAAETAKTMSDTKINDDSVLTAGTDTAGIPGGAV